MKTRKVEQETKREAARLKPGARWPEPNFSWVSKASADATEAYKNLLKQPWYRERHGLPPQ